MKKFDKEIKKLSKEFQVPDEYHKKVDEILETIVEDETPAPKSRISLKVAGIIVMCCIVLIGCLNFYGTVVAEAGIMELFKQTILDFFGLEEEESQQMGIESSREDGISKPDLFIELQEKVMDSQNIYLTVKITAPPDVELNEKVTFDYFGFCEGSNYNAMNLLSGATDCTLLELLEGKKNIGLYVITLCTDQQVEEGGEVTAFFKDLTLDPYGENPELLVEGMWSVSFISEYTVSDDAAVEKTDEAVYSFMGTTATVEDVKLLPLGLTLVSDVSNVPLEELHLNNPGITVRLKMADGSEKTVTSPDPEEAVIASGGSISEYEEEGKRFHKLTCQFEQALDTSQVVGISIEDGYVSLNKEEREGNYEDKN